MPISLSPAVAKTLLVWVGQWFDINQHLEITVANRLLQTYHNFKFHMKSYFILFWPYLSPFLLKFNDLGHFSTAKTMRFSKMSEIFKFE